MKMIDDPRFYTIWEIPTSNGEVGLITVYDTDESRRYYRTIATPILYFQGKPTTEDVNVTSSDELKVGDVIETETYKIKITSIEKPQSYVQNS